MLISGLRIIKTNSWPDMIRKNIEWGIKDELYRPEVNIDVMCKFRMESMMIPFNVSCFSSG